MTDEPTTHTPPPGGYWGACKARDIREMRRFIQKVATVEQWHPGFEEYGDNSFAWEQALDDLASEAEELLK